MIEYFKSALNAATFLAVAYYLHNYVQDTMKTQSNRTDKLYEIVIDLIKEIK